MKSDAHTLTFILTPNIFVYIVRSFICDFVQQRSNTKREKLIMSIICKEIPTSPSTHYKFCTAFSDVTPAELPSVGAAANWSAQPCFLPAKYQRYAQQIADFEVRPDDVWIVTFPKCGTTWTQEMVWLVDNDLDYATARRRYLTERFAFFEAVTVYDIKNGVTVDDNEFSISSVRRAAELPSPRYIKTHLPAELLPRQLWTVRPKIVYTARNPKDTAVSFYHHYRNIQGYLGTFDDFMEAFLADQVIWAPFHSHILNFWRVRNEPNVLFLTYEEMKRDLASVLRRVTAFFGKAYGDAELAELNGALQVDAMRAREAANGEDILTFVSSIIGMKKQDDEYR